MICTYILTVGGKRKVVNRQETCRPRRYNGSSEIFSGDPESTCTWACKQGDSYVLSFRERCHVSHHVSFASNHFEISYTEALSHSLRCRHELTIRGKLLFGHHIFFDVNLCRFILSN
jgi:hypothetical protein